MDDYTAGAHGPHLGSHFTRNHFFICLLVMCFCTPAIAVHLTESADGQAMILQPPTTAPPITSETQEQVVSPYSISIDPIGLHKAGDTVIITGRTNLPGDPLIGVYVRCIHSQTIKKMVLPCDWTSGEATVLQEPSGGFRRWYFVANTTGFAPDHYLVEAGQGAAKPGDIEAYDDANFFLLSSESVGIIERLPVRIDPIPSHGVNGSIQLQGSVANYTGEDLLITVAPGQFLPGGTWQPRTGTRNGSISGLIHVMPGSNGTNPWNFSLNATGLDHGEYSIEIKSADGELRGYGFFSLQWTIYQYSTRPGLITQTKGPQPENATRTSPAIPQTAPLQSVFPLIALGLFCILVIIQERKTR